jgi:serine/threonine protein kinase
MNLTQDQLLVENEIDILRRSQHPNIIRLLRDFKHKGRKYLVFEYCGRGDMNKMLK